MMVKRVATGAQQSAELEFLRQIRRRAKPGDGVALGIGDDCALLRARSGEEIAVTTDLSIDGRHFRLHWHPPESVGHRTLARGLSDLAAMGARPLAAFVSLGLPSTLVRPRGGGATWMSRFYDGLLALAKSSAVSLAGGDLAESPIALADIVLVGAVPRGKALMRSGARPGDAVYVTGTLGAAAAGLARLADRARSLTLSAQLRIPPTWMPQLQAHLFPQPRLHQGTWLQKHGAASSAIDVSDGLSTDLAHICEESGVAAELDAAAIPIGVGATLPHALHGGEDYELLFTAPPARPIPRLIAGVPVTRIGRVLRRRAGSPPVTAVTTSGTLALEPGGWQHFS